jgi:hypothetical protein
LFDGCVAEDAGMAEFDEDRAFGGGNESGSELEGAHRVEGARVGAEKCVGHSRHSIRTMPVHVPREKWSPAVNEGEPASRLGMD